MQANNNYYFLREGVKRTLELAKFVQLETKLKTTCWYYNIDQADKERLIDLNVKAEVAAEDLVRAFQRYYDAVDEMTVGTGARTGGSRYRAVGETPQAVGSLAGMKNTGEYYGKN